MIESIDKSYHNMNIRDLTYFIAVAEHAHFGRAAQACHISQPTLSAQLKKLENSLGVMLFERNQKQVSLTEAGTALLPYAKRIIAQVAELKDAVSALQNPLSGCIRIGLIPTIAPYWLPTMMQKLSSALPEVNWYFSEYKTDTAMNHLLNGKLDTVIMAQLEPVPGTIALPLGHESFMLAVSAQHPLANKATVTLADLQKENLLLLEEGHCLREQTTAFCKHLHNQPQHFAGTSLETLRHMIIANAGITVMPRMACIPTEGLVYKPFNKPEPGRDIILLCRDTYPKMTLLKKIQQLTKQP